MGAKSAAKNSKRRTAATRKRASPPVPAALVKITPPVLSKVYARDRLYSWFDEPSTAALVWVEGPPGAGKTTIAASYLRARKQRVLWYQVDAGDADPATFFHYLGLAIARAAPTKTAPLPHLTPEYLAGAETFAQRYFEELEGRLPASTALVFDNLHEVPADSLFHTLLRAGLERLDRNRKVLLLSRAALPPTYARLQMNSHLTRLGWEMLRLTEEEASGIAQLRTHSAVPVRQLHADTQGWIAGLILLLEGATVPQRSTEKAGTQTLFDYFAGEVFARRHASAQEFLMLTALFPSFTAAMAERLTGNSSAQSLLKELVRQHHFTEERTDRAVSYQYHPLFREFLLERAGENFGAAELARRRHRAALLLEREDQQEQALALYLTAGDIAAAVRLILTQAPQLVAAGRLATLSSIISQLPIGTLDEEPWLLYWLGISRMPFDPLQSRTHLQRAFAGFRAAREMKGMLLSWAGLMDGIVNALSDIAQADPLIEVFDELGGKNIAFPTPELATQIAPRIFIALGLRRTHHPDFDFWRQRAFAVLNGAGDTALRMLTGFYLFSYHTWAGDSAGMEAVVNKLAQLAEASRAPPLAQVMVSLAQSWHAWLNGQHEPSIQNMQQGLDLASRTGVRLWDFLLLIQGVASALTYGYIDMAEQLLTQLGQRLERARGMDKFYYFHARAWLAMLRNDLAKSRELQEQALVFATKTAIAFAEAQAHLGMAIVLHQLSQEPAAAEHLTQAALCGKRIRSRIVEFTCGLVQAEFCFDRGDDVGGLTALRPALAIGREEDYATVTWWRPKVISRVLAKALEHNIETAYVQRFIRHRGLMPDDDSLTLETWPFPVRIHTLGRFAVLIDGAPLKFSIKAQKKPMELLKAVIAMGGRQVREDKLAESLWPDADADAAALALKTTLHRLRQLLGEETIERQEGRLTLDAKRCWVDVWTFERLLADLHQACGERDIDRIVQLADRTLTAYQGAFLQSEIDAPWALSMRERLRARLLRHIELAARNLTIADRHEQAIDCFRRALEVDPLTESFYLGLMQSYVALHRMADALQAYERCRRTLKAELGVTPSAETEALVKRIRSE